MLNVIFSVPPLSFFFGVPSSHPYILLQLLYRFVSLLPASAVSSSVIQMLIFTCPPPSFVIMCLPILLSSSCFLVTPPFQFFHLPYSDLFLSFCTPLFMSVFFFLLPSSLSLCLNCPICWSICVFVFALITV